jgi:hypothetical protein
MPKFSINMCKINFNRVLHELAKFKLMAQTIVSKLKDN